jgi:carbon-monoxide dehydrogenase medium subunit
MRPFQFLEPRTTAEASGMLVEHGEGARAIAGGTSLVLMLRHRLADLSFLVDVGRLPELSGVRFDADGTLRIGALTTHGEIAKHPEIRTHFPVIADMARQVANPQIRNVATIGGNLCYGDPASDPPTCLVALGARVRVVRGKDQREIPLDGFFKGYYENALGLGDVLAEIVVPPVPRQGAALYTRFITTQAEGRPLVAAGLRVVRAGREAWSDVRLALGAVVPAPKRAAEAEAFLTGRPLTREALAQAAILVANNIDPIDDFRASAGYRREVTRVVVRRMLERAMEAA